MESTCVKLISAGGRPDRAGLNAFLHRSGPGALSGNLRVFLKTGTLRAKGRQDGSARNVTIGAPRWFLRLQRA